MPTTRQHSGNFSGSFSRSPDRFQAAYPVWVFEQRLPIGGVVIHQHGDLEQTGRVVRPAQSRQPEELVWEWPRAPGTREQESHPSPHLSVPKNGSEEDPVSSAQT